MIGLIYLVSGILLLYFSGEWLVSGSTSLAKHLNIRPFVIALTFVAFGTSAPELAISVHSAVKGYQGITLGNIIGSNIANILFAVPLAFLIRIPKTSDVRKFDCACLFFITILYLYIVVEKGSFNLLSGIFMLTILICYLSYVIYEASLGKRKVDIEEIEIIYGFKKAFLYSILGILGIVIGAQILVNGAVITATNLGISQTIIGLTIVALGTSIPEVVTSMVAAYRGHTNFILGAILGSNLFNLLAITGIASIITPINTSNILHISDIFFLIFSTVIFILITVFLRYLNKKIVFAILMFYLLYVVFIYLRMI